MKTLSDYLATYKLFPLMGVTGMSDEVATQLDSILATNYGLRTLGPIVTNHCFNGELVDPKLDPTIIAKNIYILFKKKWDNLIAFAQSDYDPTIGTTKKTVSKYSPEAVKHEGDDKTETVNGIAGFDSAAGSFADDTKQGNKLTHGEIVTTTKAGEDVVTETKQDKLVSQLMAYDLAFWDTYGLIKELCDDAAHASCLSIYSFDE